MIVVLDGTLEISGQPAKPGEAWYADTPCELSGRATVLIAN
jgi:hypothetical protein